MKNASGISLLELLLSLALSSLLIVSLSAHYLSVKRQFLKMDERLSIEEDFLLVADLLRAKIQRAGFTPCAAVNALQTPASQKLQAVSLQKGLTLASMAANYSVIRTLISPNNLIIKNTENLAANKRVLIADCYHAELAHIQSIKGNMLQLEQALIYEYFPPVYIGEWLVETFDTQTSPEGKQAFFYHLHQAEELTTVITQLETTIKKGGLIELAIRLKNGERIKVCAHRRNL